MNVAVYHCLPPGGARRMLAELLRRSNGAHRYDLFELDIGEAARDGHGLAEAVHEVRSVPVQGRSVGGPARPAIEVTRVVAAEREVVGMINAGGYDVAFVNPSRFTQAPSLLTSLAVPSLYLAQEPRRRNFEAGYRPLVDRRRGAARAVWWAGTAVFDRAVGRLDRRATAAAGALVCNSYFSAESIARAYGRPASVCYPGVDSATFRPADVGDGGRPLRSGHPGRPSVLSVGALDPTKGHDFVVGAVGLLPAASRPAVDVVYERWAPGFDDDLRGLARDVGVELRLHQGVTDAELVELYRQAAVTACAARLEPFGLSPVESLSCGTPVVAVSEGGFRETVVDRVKGELVERRPAAFAAALERAVSRRGELDPWALRATVVPRWSWESSATRLEALLAEAAAG
jgi:glycosyltransferase involved in cell wall biosynthesis